MNTIRVTCISDLHGHLIDVPKSDLLLIGGDIMPLDIQRDMDKSWDWWQEVFIPWKTWIEKRSTTVISIFGNHDFLGEHYNIGEVFTDQQIEFKGLKIWATPYQKYFHNWAFNLNDDELKKKYDLIPEDTDILLVHNPPHGILDVVEDVRCGIERRIHAGSEVLTERLKYLKNLKLVVFGHLHLLGGQSQVIDHCTFVNAAICNEAYIPANKPVVLEIKNK